jgi:hypothetical protein
MAGVLIAQTLNGVAGMNANPDDIAGRHGGRVPPLKRFVMTGSP